MAGRAPAPFVCRYQGRLLAGVDEVGRGPLIGAVVTAAVILDPERPIPGLADSKKLTEPRREALCQEIMDKALAWSLGRCDAGEIDRLNIYQATLVAMERAVAGLALPPSMCWWTATDARHGAGRPRRWSRATAGYRRSVPPRSWPRWRGIGKWQRWMAGTRVTVWPGTRATRHRSIWRRSGAWVQPRNTAVPSGPSGTRLSGWGAGNGAGTRPRRSLRICLNARV